MNITKEQLKDRITRSLMHYKVPIQCSFELLKLPFGFNRVSGDAFMFAKIFRPSITEDEMSFLPKQEIVKNVLDWAKQNGFACYYDGHSLTDTFTFYKLISKQTQ